MAPVHLAAVGGIVGQGVTQAPLARLTQVTGIGKPIIGIGIDEQARLPPRFADVNLRRCGRGVAFESAQGRVDAPRHAAEPYRQQEDGQPSQTFSENG